LSGICTRVIFLSVAAAITISLADCGSGGVRSGRHDPVVVRVGDAAITQPTVTHWMAILAPQHAVPDPPRYAACIARQRALAPQVTGAGLKEQCRQQYQSLRRQVLTSLISSQWLVGEAADQGMPVSAQEVSQRLAEKQASFATLAEFQESLNAIDHTIADLKFEIRAELAAEKIRRRFDRGEPKITRSEIADYYKRHIKSYHIPELRYFDIGENFPTAAVARQKRRDVAAGRESIHESLPRKSFTDYNGEKRIIYEVIFKAKPHVVSPPIRLNEWFYLINVTRITAPYVQSLAQVQQAIGKKLASEQQRRRLAAFVAAWRKRWTARTDCDTDDVVQKCRQYGGPKAPEDPVQLN
jgi:foldase protein PrsA